jgi:protein-S-isoprenylcysteine O-methyltransferase
VVLKSQGAQVFSHEIAVQSLTFFPPISDLYIEHLNSSVTMSRSRSRASSQASSNASTDGESPPPLVEASRSNTEPSTPIVSFQDLQTGGKLSQTSISLEAFILGATTSGGICFTIYLLLIQYAPIWRTPFFLTVLGFYHFCEFYTYARWNLKNMSADSYLTFSNGRPYTFAMSFALVETIVTSLFYPGWQSTFAQPWIQIIGLILLIGGQFIRHYAIATAGVSFNHKVQSRKKIDHQLVTWGPYRYWRHPSYFGFYWWAVGTQLLLGNALSTPIFALVLWQFFYRRIPGECMVPFLQTLVRLLLFPAVPPGR